MRVVVADDEVLLREGLARLLTEAGFEVVGKAGDADELLRAVEQDRPGRRHRRHQDATDPHRRGAGRGGADQRARPHGRGARAVPLPGVALRHAAAREHPERVGYLLKERVSDVAVLTDAIRRVAEGECVIDPTIVSRLMARRRDADRSTS